MPEGHAWVRQRGSGLVAEWPLRLINILWYCHGQGDEAFIYDGLDAITGRQFLKMSGSGSEVISIALGEGARFDHGLCVVQSRKDDEITFVFEQVE